MTSPILPNHSGNSLTSYCSPRLSLSTSRPHAETALIQGPNPQRLPLDIYRLDINMSSRAPSARAQRNNLSSSFLHSTSTLVSLKTLQTSDAPWKATELWYFEGIVVSCRYAPSLRLMQTATYFPNSAERSPILIHTGSTLYNSTPHGACGCLQRPSCKPSCRCVALHKLNATFARRARDSNKACVDSTLPCRDIEEVWNITQE